jgi:hypothetical protein
VIAVEFLAAAVMLWLGPFDARAATQPRKDIKLVRLIFDSAEHDQWVFCHQGNYSGDIDYAVGDPPRATWAAYVRKLDSCWARKHIVHIRYNHETNGTWFPWSRKSPAQFRRDFADFKAYVKRHSKHARSINFGLALNYTTHRATLEQFWTPAADYVAVSFYQTQWISQSWAGFQRSTAGPAWWTAWARRHGRVLAYGEWGATTVPWQLAMRRWGAAHGVYYGAYLYCGGDVRAEPDCGRWIAYVRMPPW